MKITLNTKIKLNKMVRDEIEKIIKKRIKKTTIKISSTKLDIKIKWNKMMKDKIENKKVKKINKKQKNRNKNNKDQIE